MLVEGRILERLPCLEPVFPLPGRAIAGNVDIEDAAVDAVLLGGLLPAEVIDAAEVVEGGFRVGAVRHMRQRLADAPRLAVGAGGEVVVARVIATDRHPGSVRQAVDGRFAELLGLRLVEVAQHIERGEIVVHEGEGILLSAEVVQGDIATAVERLERIEDVERRVGGRLRETVSDRIDMEIPRLKVEHAGGGLEPGLANVVSCADEQSAPTCSSREALC